MRSPAWPGSVPGSMLRRRYWINGRQSLQQPEPGHLDDALRDC
ncbi:MAG: hypothetical protein ABIS17_09095 [Casimicrobiaceae bacterium]